MAELSIVEPPVRGLPEWVEPTFRFTPGMDPLGLRALTAARIVAPLVPGILALSERARYLSVFAWLLHRYSEQRRPPTMAALSSYLLRREYEFALAVRLCPRHCGSSPVGTDRARPAVARHETPYQRNESVKSALGGYGLYYRSPMRVLELVRPPGTILGDEAIQIDVLNRGNPRALALVAAFDAAVRDTAYVREYIDSDDPIPEEVLVEYGARACLCRLDEFADERELLRAALLEPSEGQPADDVRGRREALALLLDLADGAPVRSDAELRWAVWAAFEGAQGRTAAHRRALTRWAALSALNFVQDGINVLWIDAARRLREQARDGALAWPEVEAALRAAADVGSLEVLGSSVACRADLAASEFAGEVAAVARQHALREVDLWAVEKPQQAIRGLVLILATLARIPTDGDGDWQRIAAVEGEWQPGLRRVAAEVKARIDEECSVGELLAWLTEHLVLRAHEANAYSKLPDFTFRWRSEAGRLRLYDHPADWDVLADLRTSAMSGLLADLGFGERTADGLRVTADGVALVAEVFG